MHGPFRLIVVQRGETNAFKMILSAPDRWPVGTAVMFDRRERERRVLQLRIIHERRQRQRRTEPDVMWHTRRFIVVETTALPLQSIRLDATAG